MNVLRIALCVFAGLLSVVATEVGTMAMLANMSAELELTGNFFISVILPVVLMVHVLTAFVFWKALEPNPVRNSALFVLAHAGFQTGELLYLQNPPGDVIGYVVVILLSGFAVTSVFRRYLWCPACSMIPPPEATG